jgi:AraC-like DNA-binding protein
LPGGMVLDITDPEEYLAAAFRAGGNNLSLIVAAAGKYHSHLVVLRLHEITLLHSKLTLPQIVRGMPKKDLCLLTFPAKENQSRVICNGSEVPPPKQGTIIFYCPGMEHIVSVGANNRWRGVLIPRELLATVSYALLRREIEPPEATRLVSVPATAMARLRSYHHAAIRLAENAPLLARHPEIARVIEREVASALVDCLAQGKEGEITNLGHQRIIQRFHRVIEARPTEALQLLDVCLAAAVSQRTLQTACKEFLGISAHRYLWLRRMSLVRRALELATRDSTDTVTSIANDHGFAQAGRFAVNYRKMFGELPSTTFNRQLL